MRFLVLAGLTVVNALNTGGENTMYKPQYFESETHRHFYQTVCSRYGFEAGNDSYHCALVYYIGAAETLRRHWDTLYDPLERTINPEALHASFITHESGRLLRLAYDLFHGGPVLYDTYYTDAEKQLMSYTASSLFAGDMLEVKLEAVRIRFGFEVSI